MRSGFLPVEAEDQVVIIEIITVLVRGSLVYRCRPSSAWAINIEPLLLGHSLMKQSRYIFRAVFLVGLVAVVANLGCTKSTMKGFPNLFSGSPDKETTLGSDAAKEVGDALRGVGKASLTIWHDSFDSAKAAAADSGKPILADFTGSDWCHWCVKLKEDVFEKDEFKEWARDNVILLELDYPKRSSQAPSIKKQNAELARRYNVSGYPTVLLLTPDGEVMGKLGYDADVSKWVKSAEAILAK